MINTIDFKYYVYRHLREDTNQVFYIGVGTKRRNEHDYQRAYSKHGRNTIWKKIVNKTTYTVEIIMEFSCYAKALDKEKELIFLYGRKDLKTGTLSNVTIGGQGCPGKKLTKEQRNKISERQRGKCSNNQRFVLNTYRPKAGEDHPLRKPIYQYDSNGYFIKKWESRTAIIESLKLKVDINRKTLSYGYQWKSEYLGEKIPAVFPKSRKKAMSKIVCYDIHGNALMCFYGINAAVEELKISRSKVKKSLSNTSKHPRTYIFKYANTI